MTNQTNQNNQECYCACHQYDRISDLRNFNCIHCQPSEEKECKITFSRKVNGKWKIIKEVMAQNVDLDNPITAPDWEEKLRNQINEISNYSYENTTDEIIETIHNLLQDTRQQERERVIEEIRSNFVQFAIDGKNVEDEWKGATLYMKTLQFLEKLKKV